MFLGLFVPYKYPRDTQKGGGKEKREEGLWEGEQRGEREEEEGQRSGEGKEAYLYGSVLMFHQITQASTQPVFPSKYKWPLCSTH